MCHVAGVRGLPTYALRHIKNEECRTGRILGDLIHNQWPSLTCFANEKADVLRGGRSTVHGDVWISVACDQINYFLTSPPGVFHHSFFMS